MSKRLHRARTEESGFTLVELLVVIAILGILAAVVVFAVGGITDKGQGSACEIDQRTLRTAEEAHFAQNGTYVNQTTSDLQNDLVPDFLSKAPSYHTVTAIPDDPGTATVDETGYSVNPVTTGTNANKC